MKALAGAFLLLGLIGTAYALVLATSWQAYGPPSSPAPSASAAPIASAPSPSDGGIPELLDKAVEEVDKATKAAAAASDDAKSMSEGMKGLSEGIEEIGAELLSCRYDKSNCEALLGDLIAHRCDPAEMHYYRAKRRYPPKHMNGPARFRCPPGHYVWVNPRGSPDWQQRDFSDWAFICTPDSDAE